MARLKNKNNQPTPEELVEQEAAKFALRKSAIKSMYEDDATLKNNTQSPTNTTSTINTMDLDTLETQFYSIGGGLDNQRRYSQEAYIFYPTYAVEIDYLANMFTWDYIYTPRAVKEKASSANFAEQYALMSEVVDGISIETVYPATLTKLMIDGVVYLYGVKTTGSKTVSLMSLNPKYCRPDSVTQFGTLTYQFDYQYFDNLGVKGEELENLLSYFPPEMQQGYRTYVSDKNKMRWQRLNPKFAAAIAANEKQFPTKLRALFALKRYDIYQENELERALQQLDKIIAHEMPTWQDKLIVGIDEMSELHKSIRNSISKNAHAKLVTTFGKLNVLDIGKDSSKENRVLANARDDVYDNLGENSELFSGANEGALKYGLKRDESIMWKYVQQLTAYYNVLINNLYNFKGYQCDLQIMPVTVYNRTEMLNLYRESASLGVGKLEYMVSSGTKQVNIASKIELENFLKLEELRPLATSYTQSSQDIQGKNSDDTDETDDETQNPKSSSADDSDAATDAPTDKPDGGDDSEVNDEENPK